MSAQTLYPLASRSHTVPTPEKGEIILFLTTYNKEIECPFRMGRNLESKEPGTF